MLAAGPVAVAIVCFAAGYWLWQPRQAGTSPQPVANLAPAPAPATPTAAPPVAENATLTAAAMPGSAVAAVPEVAAAVSATAVAAASDETPLAQAWPADFAATRSMDEAFVDLAGLWGIPAPTDNVDFCAYAHDNKLDCLSRRDSLEALRAINRPAILTLYGDDGEPFHVVMATLGSDRALFIAGNEQHELALSAIASRWFGEYFLLWQRPSLKKEILHPGGSGDSVRWLARTLQELGLYQATGREVRLEGALLGAFKHFQFSSGLTPDGILGPMSLIHLNTAGNQTGPRLGTREAS